MTVVQLGLAVALGMRNRVLVPLVEVAGMPEVYRVVALAEPEVEIVAEM